MNIKSQSYNELSGIIKTNFGKKFCQKRKVIYINAKAALKCGSEVWVLNIWNTKNYW
jgi:hypothetical protein